MCCGSSCHVIALTGKKPVRANAAAFRKEIKVTDL